jgi:hypothetical protein
MDFKDTDFGNVYSPQLTQNVSHWWDVMLFVLKCRYRKISEFVN